MKRAITLALLALTAAPLAACVDGMGLEMSAPGPYAYDGYYDGYYGQVYDGYWGSDGYFYYRGGEGEGAYRRGDRQHFAREAPQGQGNYRHIQGNTAPRQGVRAPHYPGGGGRDNRGRDGDRPHGDRGNHGGDNHQ
jgi:hypothetical protein